MTTVLTRVLLLAALALAIAMPAAQAQYEPPGTIVVSPVSPEAGADVLVTVTGCFPAGESVDILIDGIVVGSATPDADGGFTTTVTVPSNAQGEIEVTVTCGSGAVLSSVITVSVPNLPFQDATPTPVTGATGGALPRTGSDSIRPMALFGASLLGLGALFVIVAGRRRDDHDQPAHASAH